MNKKRILLVNEASYLNTGYANYGMEVMRRLYQTNKYELAELACYVDHNDPRNSTIPWKLYINKPSNEQEKQQYKPDSEHEFGLFKFDETCLNFRPDIVCSIRDPWMDNFINKSWFRKNYYYAYMSPIDSAPLQEQWIDQFAQCNAIFTYTDWGFEQIKKQSGNKVNLIQPASPGISPDDLPLIKNKLEYRKKLRLPEDGFIIGTIMRNQKRKLYSDLFDAFGNLLKNLSDQQKSKTFLYLHTSYPDLGWDIPRLVKDSGFSHKIFFTYVCKNCKQWFASRWQDARTVCVYCQEAAALTPSTQYGLNRQDMHIMCSLFDIYVQYAAFEGLGMPQLDAACAGVPIFAINYSGMEDIVKKIEATPIKVKQLSRECESYRLTAVPDNEDFVEKVKKFMSLPDSMRHTKGIKTRKLAEKCFNWDNTAKVWENHFDSIDVKDHNQTWKSPIRLHYINNNCPNNLSNEAFVHWAIINIAGRPELLNTYFALQMVRDLTWTATLDSATGLYFNDYSVGANQNKLKDFSRQNVVEICTHICNNRNYWEQRREQIINGD